MSERAQRLTREARSQIIRELPDAELEGYYFPTAEAATQAAIEIALQNPNRISAWFDIDDTSLNSEPWLRARLNQRILSVLTDFAPVTLTELLAHSGRYFQVPRYQQAASEMGLTFGALWQEVSLDAEAHASMLPFPQARELQQTFSEGGAAIAGYPTARPQDIIRLTAASLKHHHLAKAPVIDTQASSADPSHAKLAFFRERVLPYLPEDHQLYLVDDHASTAIAIKEALNGRVEVLVPIVARNRDRIDQLRHAGVTYGTLNELVAFIRQKYPKLNTASHE